MGLSILPETPVPSSTRLAPRKACESILEGIGIDASLVPVAISGDDPVVPSVWRLGTASSAALGALGTVMSQIHHERTGILDSVDVSVEEAIMQISAICYTTLNGVGMVRLFEDPSMFKNCGFYQAGDGHWLYLITVYPHLQQTICDVLGCPPGKQNFTAKVREWPDAFALEAEVCARGGCAAVVRSRQEWEATEQGRLCSAQDLIVLEKIADGPPEPLPPIFSCEGQNPLPLQELKILDNTHVIAGPMAARTMAEHGATVYHMSSPEHPDPPALTNETGLGKKNFFCDLTKADEVSKFWRLVEDVDVYTCSYLSLDRKGFDPGTFAARRPGIVFLDFHCYGQTGPWFGRGGFDQLACSATGYSSVEGGPDGPPRLPPTTFLNDYMAGILGLTGACAALLRRHREGGSYRVHVNLAKVCTWVQDLGRFERSEVEHLQSVRPNQDHPSLKTARGPCGTTKYLPTRVHYSSMRPELSEGAEPLGATPLDELLDTNS